ncbi:MAG: hypothetical protein GY798_26100 [Hyphomicrobiales bacterium]|nr:hypothetical protein [Hyphomicrobiales bacterium]
MRQAPAKTIALFTSIAIAVAGIAIVPESTEAAKLGRSLLKRVTPSVVTPKPKREKKPKIKRPGKKIVTPDPVRCKLPAIYAKRLGRCITPKLPEKVVKPVVNRGIIVVPKPDVATCKPPARYSSRLERCYIPKDPQPEPVSCKWPTEQQGSVCVCVSGYKPNGKGGCYQPRPEVAKPQVTVDVRHIQECLTVLDFNPGPIDGLRGPATQRAWRAFQEANGLAKRRVDLTDKVTEVALYRFCHTPEAPPEVTPEAPPVVTVALAGPLLATPIPPQQPGHCLPQDLHVLHVAAYGPNTGVSACTPQSAACLPKPAFFGETLLHSAAAEHGIRWCDACVSLNGWLPLNKILQMEAAANITLCAAPAALCYLPSRPVVHTQTEVRTLYEAYPVSVDNDKDIAVVIGNENYGDRLHRNVYGHADADAMTGLLTEQLGYQPENIIDLRDATRADLERVFGNEDAPTGELAARLDGDDPGDVIVYVSSHGMASDTGIGYLLPVDADPEDLAGTAYPLQRLHTNLGQAGARTIMLMLEATFSDTVTDVVDAPNLPEMDVMAMPEQPIAGLAVFTAADRDQHSLEDPEYGIGLFTRYMISGLAGAADQSPVGNKDNRIDTIELFVYTADKVRMTARKSFGLEQKPLLSKIDNLVVGDLALAE